VANVFLQQGDVKVLDRLRLDGQTLFELHLFQNDHVPVVTDGDLSFTVATFSGYVPILLGPWSAAFINGLGKGEIDAGPAVFAHNGGATANIIYGAFVVDAAGHVVYAERFPAPQVMSAMPDTITYTPVVTAVSQ
jgi:hypothetical protein